MAVRMLILSVLAIGFVGTSALAAKSKSVPSKEYTFKELSLYDYAQMDKLVRRTMGANTIDDNEREPKIRQALKIVLSRHNTDGKRTALFIGLQTQLPEPFFISSLKTIAEGAIVILNDERQSNITRATAFLILENMLAEIQPHAKDFSDILVTIRDAKVEVNDSLRSYRRLEGMDTNQSPSELAANILKKSDHSENQAVAQANPDLAE